MKTNIAHMKKLVTALTIAGVLAATAPAQAVTVFDAANFAQNKISAVKAVLTEAHTYKSLIEQTKQTIQMVRSVASINGLSELAGLQEELALYQALEATTTEVQGVMNNSRTLYNDLNAMMGASDGMNWQTFLSAKNVANNGRIENLMRQMGNANTELQQVQQRRMVLLQKAQQAGANQSLMQAAQVTNGQLDTIIGQQQQMIALTNNRVADKALEEEKANLIEQAERKARTDYQRSLRESAAAIH